MDFEDAKEEIRERLDLVEVIGQHVRLRRSGARFIGLCPFHQDSAPSFSVDPERGFWHCFGCGEGGDLFSFVMRQEGLDFGEALRVLARRAGVTLESDPGADDRRRHRELLERANEIAREHFVRNLFDHPAAKQARSYLRGRGLNKWAVETFALGYALDSWDDLLNTLAAQGINTTIAQEAGLAKAGERGGHYDTFRDRIIFPISDVSGRTIAFGGRALDPENPAKYLNSPETPLFHKRRTLYALDLARPVIGNEGRAVIVEGYTDVISLHQAGIRNVVAGLGTALTREQLDLVGRHADEVVLVYDADAAGARAALRNLEVFEGAEVAVSLVVLPENLDPDDFVRSRGPQTFRELLDERISPIEYELRMIFDEHASEGPEGAARVARDAVDVLLKVEDWTRRDEFVTRAADLWGLRNPGRTDSMARVLKFELSRRGRSPQLEQRRSPQDPSYITQTLTRTPSGLLRAETELLAQMLDDTELARWAIQQLRPEDMVIEADAAILSALEEQLARDGNLDARDIVDGLPEEEGVRGRGVELTVTQVRRAEREDEDDRRAQAEETIERLKMHRTSGGISPMSDRATAVLPDEEMSAEDFRELERKVLAGINTGELTRDDPVVKQYLAIRSHVHGRGGGGFVGDQTPSDRADRPAEPGAQPGMDLPPADTTPAGAARDRHDPQAPAETSADDPWAVEEGDPFSDEG